MAFYVIASLPSLPLHDTGHGARRLCSILKWESDLKNPTLLYAQQTALVMLALTVSNCAIAATDIPAQSKDTDQMIAEFLRLILRPTVEDEGQPQSLFADWDIFMAKWGEQFDATWDAILTEVSWLLHTSAIPTAC